MSATYEYGSLNFDRNLSVIRPCPIQSPATAWAERELRLRLWQSVRSASGDEQVSARLRSLDSFRRLAIQSPLECGGCLSCEPQHDPFLSGAGNASSRSGSRPWQTSSSCGIKVSPIVLPSGSTMLAMKAESNGSSPSSHDSSLALIRSNSDRHFCLTACSQASRACCGVAALE